MQTLLAALRDIPGVVGSFVLSREGQLIAREMPAVYPDEIFPELGRRMTTVGEVVGAQTGSVQELLMKFDAYCLHVRHADACFLSVLAADTVNVPALRMATNVALKQVLEKIASMPPPTVAAEPTSAPAPASSAAQAPATEPAAPAKPRRSWRGQLID